MAQPYKTYLDVSYNEREKAKDAGAKWDSEEKLWYAVKGKIRSTKKWRVTESSTRALESSTKHNHLIGAIEKLSNKYTYPKNANKKYDYECPDCREDVIPRQGKVRTHHFAHKRSSNNCSYYNNPNEAQIHKDAKLLMESILKERKTITFNKNVSAVERSSEITSPK